MYAALVTGSSSFSGMVFCIYRLSTCVRTCRTCGCKLTKGQSQSGLQSSPCLGGHLEEALGTLLDRANYRGQLVHKSNVQL